MNDDEKTARGGFGGPRRAPPTPGKRTTAPVGTPVDPAASRMQSDRPLNSAGMKGPPLHIGGPGKLPAPPSSSGGLTSPVPRTLGGHTARLNVADAEPLSSPPPRSSPYAVHDSPAPLSRTVGATVRVSPAAGPLPGHPVAGVASPPPPLPAPPPAPLPQTPTMTAPPPAPLASAPSPLAGTISMPATSSSAAAARPEDRIEWTAPLPVAVGLVFFAIGSLIAIAADNRAANRARGLGVAGPPIVAVTSVTSGASSASSMASASPAASGVVPATSALPTAASSPASAQPGAPLPGGPRTPPPPPSSKGPPAKGQRPDLPF